MKHPIVLGWRFWRNPRILTLECEHDSIASCPDVICSFPGANLSDRPIYKNSKGEEVCADKVRELLFMQLLKIVIGKNKKSVIERVIFCRQGIDIELSKEYHLQTIYEIMGHIEKHIRGTFSGTRVKFKDNNDEY